MKNPKNSVVDIDAINKDLDDAELDEVNE